MTQNELDYVIEQLIISHNNHRVMINYNRKDFRKFFILAVAANAISYTTIGVISAIALRKIRQKDLKDKKGES